MAQPVFVMRGVRKLVPPKRELLKDISLSFLPGAKIGVLGANGAGKSTLLRIMAGVDKEFDGEARAAPGIDVGYLPQEPELDPDKDVRANVEEALGELRGLVQRYNDLTNKLVETVDDQVMAEILEQQAALQDQIEARDAWDLEHRLEVAAVALRLPPWDADVCKLSGGEKRRVALCRLLLMQPDMLLLDEPTNHLDADSVAWLEKYLQSYPGTVVAVTHDRYFLDHVAGWILELDRGRGIPFEGNYSAWLEAKQKRLAVEERQEEAQQRAIKAELEWVHANPKARQAKSKARLKRFTELLDQDFQKHQETNQLYIPPGPRLGDVVVEVNHLHKTMGDRVLIDDLSCKVPPGAVVGVIGPNGAGKTTFFRLLTGEAKPDEGTIRCGDTVRMAYVDQSRDALEGDRTVWDVIADGQDIIRLGTYEIPSRQYVARFNFTGSDQQKHVANLSGGERNRVHLAKVIKSGGNVLLLDEPTNDLDVATLRALEEAIMAFPGCVFAISHDRYFLDRIATHILSFEGDGHVEWFEGNYTDYEADRERRLSQAQPGRTGRSAKTQKFRRLHV